MSSEAREAGDEPHCDETATERPADQPPESPSEHHSDSEESGGPLGNPGVDEETLRKQQEESSERSE
jgi:hypothetical protein